MTEAKGTKEVIAQARLVLVITKEKTKTPKRQKGHKGHECGVHCPLGPFRRLGPFFGPLA